MKRLCLALIIGAALYAQQRRRRPDSEIFHTEIPAHPYDVILGRVTATSVTARAMFPEESEAFVEYVGKKPAPVLFKKATPQSILLDGLQPDTDYTYQLRYRKHGTANFESSPPYRFHTQRKPGAAFTFAIQADSHLDENTDPATYVQSLNNVAAAKPDFFIDLGDTFMTDKRRKGFREAFPQYVAQRYYFGLVSHSAPLFLVLGNHDGESGSRSEMAAWANDLRTRYFPNPRPDGFFTGNNAPLENYYAWHWGDALFVALDPYGATETRGRDDNWHWTLGDAQYRWLKQTLEQSPAKFKFVFLHHPTGAKGQPIRGGIEAAKYNEWGGRNEDGTAGFRTHRPNWEMPVHQMLVKNKVSAVFHGHDHMYVREELDGIVYQAVPQAGNTRTTAPRNAEEYGYLHGGVLGGSGFLRISVTPTNTTVDFLLTGKQNGKVASSYSIR